MPHDLFVSYSQPDREAAFALVERVEARGHRAWIAPRNVAPAADWAAEIIDAIADARLMLLVFSGSSNDSSQVRREVERAVHKHVPILPFRLENVLPSKSLEYFLSSQHWMDAFPPPLEPHIDRLCDDLDRLLHRRAPIDPPAESLRLHDAPGRSGALDAIDASQLQRLQMELVKCIGPVAAHLVRRAARTGGDVQMLAQRLASEIDDERERQCFLDACRRIGKRT